MYYIVGIIKGMGAQKSWHTGHLCSEVPNIDSGRWHRASPECHAGILPLTSACFQTAASDET